MTTTRALAVLAASAAIACSDGASLPVPSASPTVTAHGGAGGSSGGAGGSHASGASGLGGSAGSSPAGFGGAIASAGASGAAGIAGVGAGGSAGTSGAGAMAGTGASGGGGAAGASGGGGAAGATSGGTGGGAGGGGAGGVAGMAGGGFGAGGGAAGTSGSAGGLPSGGAGGSSTLAPPTTCEAARGVLGCCAPDGSLYFWDHGLHHLVCPGKSCGGIDATGLMTCDGAVLASAPCGTPVPSSVADDCAWQTSHDQAPGNVVPTTCNEAHGALGCCGPDGNRYTWGPTGLVVDTSCSCGWSGYHYVCSAPPVAEPTMRVPMACGAIDPALAPCDGPPTTCEGAHGETGCCDADGRRWFWAGAAVGETCLGGTVCGWDGTKYACVATAGADPSGVHPLACNAPPAPDDVASCNAGSGGTGGAGAGGGGAGGATTVDPCTGAATPAGATFFPWGQYQRCSNLSGQSAVDMPPAPKGFAVRWTFASSASCGPSSPVIDDAGVVYVVLGDGRVHAISAGVELWSVDVGGAASPGGGSVALSLDGTLFVGSQTYLYAMTRAGKLLWGVPAPHCPGAACGAPGTGFLVPLSVRQNDATVYAPGSGAGEPTLGAKDGSVVFTMPGSYGIHAPATVDAIGYMVGTGPSGGCEYDELLTGCFTSFGSLVPTAIAGSDVHMTLATDGSSTQIRIDQGAQPQAFFPGVPRGLAWDAVRKRAVVATSNAALVEVDANAVPMPYAIPSSARVPPVLSRDGVAYVAGDDGTLWAILDGGVVWSTPLPSADVSPLAIAADGSIVVCVDGIGVVALGP